MQSQWYRFGVAEHEHLVGIEKITKKISQEHGKILRNNCLRIWPNGNLHFGINKPNKSLKRDAGLAGSFSVPA